MKNNMKRLLSFVLALLMLVSVTPYEVFAQSEEILNDEKIEEPLIEENSQEVIELEKAIAAVEKAEETKEKADYELALELVNKLEGSEKKSELLERLEAIDIIIEKEEEKEEENPPQDETDDPEEETDDSEELDEDKPDAEEPEKDPIQEETDDPEELEEDPVQEDTGESEELNEKEPDEKTNLLDDESEEIVEDEIVEIDSEEISNEKLELQSAKNRNDIDAVIRDLQQYQIDTVPAPSFGTSAGEWTVFGLARTDGDVPSGYYEGYYKRIEEKVKKIIRDDETLHPAKSTENSRLIVALTAIGKDPRNVGGHNLLKGLSKKEFIPKQGINGPIWALIAFDTMDFEIPETTSGTQNTRESMIQYILSEEITDNNGTVGGWALTGNIPDPDITAMALYALAPYKDRTDVNPYIERGLNVLSDLQKDNGGFYSWGSINSESISQVLIGLTALGIDPDTDTRFIKNGNTAVDALLEFRDSSGGFKHILSKEVDGMATDQALQGLGAYQRFKQGKIPMFDNSDVMLEPTVIDIEIKKLPNKLEYKTTDEFLNPFGIEVYGTYNNGQVVKANMVDIDVSQPDFSIPGKHEITVTYKDLKDTFEITVNGKVPEVVDIEITKKPNKTVYDLGEELDLTGLVVNKVYDDDTKEELASSDYTLSEVDMTTSGEKTIRVSYENYEKEFTITVNEKAPEVVDIEISKKPNKTVYDLGEELDLTGLVVNKVYDDDTKEELTSSDYTLSEVDMTTSGEKTVIVSYKDKTASFTITVNEKAPEVVDIEITKKPDKTVYDLGERFDKSGLVVSKVYSDNSKEILSENEYNVSNPDMTTSGEKTITVSYENYEKEFTITVNKKVPEVVDIEISKKPNKTVYDLGEELDLTGLVVNKVYDDDTKEELASSDYTLSEVDMTTSGEKTVIVSYKDKTARFNITVNEPVLKRIEITKKPNKTIYEIGESINISGIKVEGIYKDGSRKEINSRNLYVVNQYVTNKPGEKDVKILYNGFIESFKITVNEPQIVKISIEKEPKTQFEVGDTLSIEGLKVIAHYTNKEIKAINNSDLTISNVDMEEPGNKTIYISYENKQTSYVINVKEKGSDVPTAFISVVVPKGPTVYTNGKVMQAKKEFEIIEGKDTAFSILQKTGLSYLYNYHPVYDGVYVSSIEGLAEFDGGSGSGWMYRVNGWFPNYSSSLYELKDGDYVEWIYTRDLGIDLGAYVEDLGKTEEEKQKVVKYITAKAEKGGIIAPSGMNQVTKENPVEFKIIPDSGNVVYDVILDGKSLGAIDKFTANINNITKNSTIVAKFTKAGEDVVKPVSDEELKKLEAENKVTEVPEPEDSGIMRKFTDVKGHWAYDYIKYVVEKGYFKGTSETTFEPNTKMTRGMFVTVFGRMENISERVTETEFDDVDSNSYYAAYVKWANENNIIKGVGNNKFEPNREITREEMAEIMANYLKYKNVDIDKGKKVIKDESNISDWAKDSVHAMYSMGLLKGKTDGKFHPEEDSTRGEIATIIFRIDSRY